MKEIWIGETIRIRHAVGGTSYSVYKLTKDFTGTEYWEEGDCFSESSACGLLIKAIMKQDGCTVEEQK